MTRSTAIFQLGNFRLHSGTMSSFKIDLDSLSDEDLDAVAEQLALRVPRFGQVEGVPSGGLRLAEALIKYAQGPSHVLLIVDDVLTTGSSMENQRSGRDAHGAVIFARGLSWPSWVVPLFVMAPVEGWTPKEDQT